MKTLPLLSLAALLAAPAPADDSSSGIPAAIVAKVNPSVVAIKHERAQGSGFILTADGYILSNGHVVRGEDPEDPLLTAESISVQLFDDRIFPAQVVGFWMDPDVALLKINADTPLRPAELADSRAVRTGQRCFAVGNPAGLRRTYTGGLLSNVDRTDLGTEVPVLQTDAAINPGNSGGPLFDMDGRVIGINTYGMQQSNNLGFTLPTHVILAVKESIAKNGRFLRGSIGNVMLRELDEGLSVTTGVKSGIMVHHVEPGEPAAAAGLRSGDVLVALDGRPVAARSRAEALTFEWENITLSPPGRKMKLEVVHPGEPDRRTLEFTVEEASPMPKTAMHSGELRAIVVDALGLSVTDIVPFHRFSENLRDDDGVMVSKVSKDSAAAKAGLNPGDFIASVGGRAVKDTVTFSSALLAALDRREKAFEIKIVRGATRFPSAVMPVYPARDARVLVLAGSDSWPHLNVLMMELAASGCRVDTQSLDKPDAARLKATADEPPCALLLVGWKGDAVLTEPHAALVASVNARKGTLAAAGEAVAPLARAMGEIKGCKLTAANSVSPALSAMEAVFTGMDVESDGNLLTTTGRDRKIVRKFIRALVGRMGGEDEIPPPPAD